jgi:DNA-binding transcriptional ArsR family regulator
MSWQHIHAVRDLELPHVEKVILYALASRVDDGGACWPSLDTLAKDAGLARRTLQYHLSILVDTGLVSREERRGATTVMRLHLRAPDTSATDSGAHGTDADVRGMHGDMHAVREMHAPRASEVKELPLNPQDLPRTRELSTTRAGNSQNSQTPDPRSSAARAWWVTHAGIDQKGRELDVAPRPGEPYDEYKRRLLEIEKTRRRAEVSTPADARGDAQTAQ